MLKRISWCDASEVSFVLTDEARNYVTDIFNKVKDSDDLIGPSLETKIRATHSGQLIKGRCYTGWGMKKGTGSWYSSDNGGTSAFDKPVIRNHDITQDAIGRVVKAEFIQLKDGKEWLKDWASPDIGPDKMGSGYIITTCHISDSDAIQKIMDKRLLTVSSRQTPLDVWCSVDGNHVSEGCDHCIGEYYEVDSGDEVLCYAVTGQLDYVELSFVNAPRQVNAKTLSFQMIKDMSDSNEQISVESNLASQTVTPYLTKLGSQRISLTDSEFPSTDLFTGSKTVSMAKKIEGAAPGIELKGAEDKAKINDDVVDSDTVEDTIENKKLNNFNFMNLARHWKDNLNLSEEDYTDFGYAMGITNKSAGHAHVFDVYVDGKDRVVRGNTYATGQGKAKTGHGHAIWVDEVDMNTSTIAGDTRDASAGESHVHSFNVDMTDAESLHATIISDVKSIKEAAELIDLRVNEDTLDSEQSSKLLKDKDVISWDKEMLDAALPLIGRLDDCKRAEIIQQIYDAGLFGNKPNEDELMNSDTLRLLTSIQQEKDDLKSRLADATQLADSKEAERKALLEEKRELVSMKIRFMADTLARLEMRGTEFTDEDLDAKVSEYEGLDVEDLDSRIKEQIAIVPEKTVEDSSEKEESKSDMFSEEPERVVLSVRENEKDSQTDPNLKNFDFFEEAIGKFTS